MTVSKEKKMLLYRRSTAKRETVLKRFGRRCRYCQSAEDLSIDHIVPISRGGNSCDENLAIACRKCNLDKGDMTHEEYKAELKRRKKWRVRPGLRGQVEVLVKRKRKEEPEEVPWLFKSERDSNE